MAIVCILVIAEIILFQPAAGPANDSTARFGAGGMELTKSEDIRILEEILEISTKKIRVKYRFLNDSDKDIHTMVAFPLPKYNPLLGYYSPVGEFHKIMETFRVSVNDTPVEIRGIRRVLVDNIDITGELRKSGLRDSEIFGGCPHEDKSPECQRYFQIRKEIGDWEIEEIVFWRQSFPAKKGISVEHEYSPAVGGGYAPVGSIVDKNIDDLWKSFTGMANDRDEACLDEKTKRGIQKRIRQMISGDVDTIYYASVEYILSTGRNWKGPIGEFKLRLVKEKPEEFVSVCFPGNPTKVGSTVYEFVRKDYVPQDKLVVFFYDTRPN